MEKKGDVMVIFLIFILLASFVIIILEVYKPPIISLNPDISDICSNLDLEIDDASCSSDIWTVKLIGGISGDSKISKINFIFSGKSGEKTIEWNENDRDSDGNIPGMPSLSKIVTYKINAVEKGLPRDSNQVKVAGVIKNKEGIEISCPVSDTQKCVS